MNAMNAMNAMNTTNTPTQPPDKCPACGETYSTCATIVNQGKVTEILTMFRCGYHVYDSGKVVQECLRAALEMTKGAMLADDKRLLDAGLRVGMVNGCDNPDAMADEILSLRAERDAALARAEKAEGENAILRGPILATFSNGRMELNWVKLEEHVLIISELRAELAALRARLAELQAVIEKYIEVTEFRQNSKGECYFCDTNDDVHFYGCEYQAALDALAALASGAVVEGEVK